MGQWDNGSLTTGSVTSGAPRLLRPRGSQTGSLFHENVWPPPNEVIQDPLITPDDLGSSISLAIGMPLAQTVATATTTSEAVGAGRQRRRVVSSSAYESVRSLDTTDYDRSHSRSDSIEPLLDQNTAGRTMSTSPPSSMRPISPPNYSMTTRPRDGRFSRSNLRASYTADDLGTIPHVTWSPQGARQSLYSVTSIPKHELSSSPASLVPDLALNDNSDLVRDVLLAGERAGSTDSREIPPIKRTNRDFH